MKVTIERDRMSKAVNAVAKVISSRPVREIMGGIHLVANEDVLELGATDGAVDIMERVSCRVDEPGEVVIEGKKLTEICRSMPVGEIVIHADDSKPNVIVRSKNGSKFTLAKMNGDFPDREALGESTGVTVTISGYALREALNTVKYAAAIDQTRPVLTGVLMEVKPDDKLQAVALDGFRLALCQKECEVSGVTGEVAKLILPISAVNAVINECQTDDDITITTDGKSAKFTMYGGEIVTTLLAGEYIDYRKIITRDWKCSSRFETSAAVEALKRASIVANSGKNHLVRLTFRDGGMLMESNSHVDSFSEEVPCQHSGEEMRTAYNTRYFLETLTATNAEEVQLDLTSELAPGVVRMTNGQREVHVILPVRVANE